MARRHIVGPSPKKSRGTGISPSVCGPAPDQTVYGATGTKINWQSLKTIAPDAAGLVDQVSMQLLNTKLPKAQRIRAINAVSAVTLGSSFTNTQLLDRVRMAVYLIAVSPLYQVEF